MTSDWTTHAKGTGQYAEVNGINIYYETHGSGRPLILLHGPAFLISCLGPTRGLVRPAGRSVANPE